MKQLTLPVLCLLLSPLASAVYGEPIPRFVSLSATPPGEEVEWVVKKGDYKLILTDAMPSATYLVTVDQTYEGVPPPQGERSGSKKLEQPDECDTEVQKLNDALLSATSEDAVRFEISRALSDADPTCTKRLNQKANHLTRRRIPFEVNVLPKYASIVHVKRLSTTGEVKTWEIRLTTGPGGAWISMPMMAILQDRGEKWFAQSDPVTKDDGSTEERYRLIREDRGFDLKPGAGVTFAFVPGSQRDNSTTSWVLMAGLGVNDSATPLLFTAGGGLLIGDHVSLSIGVAGTWERQLLGRYRGQEFVDANLTNDQLTDENLVLRPFLSIGIDFKGFDIASGGKKAKPPAK